MAPTVITDLQPDSRCMTEEIFGPVACVVPFDEESEVAKNIHNHASFLEILKKITFRWASNILYCVLML